ncbi:M15 family metallopeptidase [Candidatus Dependentiae bacterium]|nr:M15 family metallopeptidase [Candidatus Dependentiae bacterium]
MKKLFSSVGLALISLGYSYANEHKHNLISVHALNPRIVLNIKYATADNFMHKKLYSTSQCYVHTALGERLTAIQQELETLGLGLKIFDAYRPLSLEETIRVAAPEEAYVSATPTGCAHNRGTAVDVTLVKADGSEIIMPSEYDEFTLKTRRSYTSAVQTALSNRDLLEKLMVKYGFISYDTNWWHFELPHSEHYPLLDISFEDLAR